MTRFAVGLLLVALPAALVAQQPTKAPQTQAPAKPAAQAPSSTTFPKGTYVVKMQDGSVIEVTFADGTYSALSDGQLVATGKYTTKGDQIVVSDDSQDCGNSGEGTYTWAYDGKTTLTFKGNHDACDTRLGIMTGYAFIKK
jgi:hypothetical protein